MSKYGHGTDINRLCRIRLCDHLHSGLTPEREVNAITAFDLLLLPQNRHLLARKFGCVPVGWQFWECEKGVFDDAR